MTVSRYSLRDLRRSFPLVTVRAMEPGDWPTVSRIYGAGLATGIASLVTAVPSWDVWDREHLPGHRWVVAEDGISGWAALAYPHRTTSAGVAETSVYVDPEASGRGLGSQLLRHLVLESERAGFWTLEARILEANVASVRLHVACGFRLVGVRELIGVCQGQWCNVLLFERRSKIVG